MEPDVPSPCSLQPANDPYSELGDAIPPPQNIFFHPQLVATSSSFSSGFKTKILYQFLTPPKRTTCPAFITVFGEEYKLWTYNFFSVLLFLTLKSEYSHKHPIMKHPTYTLFL
jgi:hypothetical protein